jgi:L,D-peptidoglycan transpeptidase YkuD (ErfK/YbiS/YcfS/YnhG family)
VLPSRRSVVIACTGIAAVSRPLLVMASRVVDLTYSAGRLSWPGGETPAACGRSGVRADKREGDGASPAGTFSLWCCYYRPDRLAAPRTGLSLIPLRPNDGWCDDSGDLQYNRLVSLPYPASHEDMWHDDDLYDLVVPTGYNMESPVPGRGSAIFLHVATPDFQPTAGCIAIARDALLALLPRLGLGSTITIRP